MNPWRSSAMPRLMQCVAASVLPQVERSRIEVAIDELEAAGNEAAARGVAIHAYLEALLTKSKEEALASVPERYREYCASIDLDDPNLPAGRPHSFVGETQMAYSLITGEVELRAPFGLHEVGGKPDVIGLTESSVIVWDYKTGSKFLGDPKAAWQLRTYVLMAMLFFKRESGTGGFIRLDADGKPHPYYATFTKEELLGYRDEIHAQYARALDAEGLSHSTLPYTEGAECGFCPSFQFCRAKTTLLAAGMTELEDGVTLAPEMIGKAWERSELIIKAAERMQKLIKESVKALGPIDLPNGKQLLLVEKKRASIDVEKATPHILEKYGDTSLGDLITESISVTDFDEYVGKLHLSQFKKGKTEAISDARAWLQKTGALSYKAHLELQERTPPKKQLTTESKGDTHGEETTEG